MTNTDGITAPVAGLLDRVIADPKAREAAKAELLRLSGSQPDLPTPELSATQMAALLAEAQSRDAWTNRARPTFLYVMYALLLWSLPMGLIAAVHPATARAIVTGMTAYLNGLPEPLYTLFGTGYLGYTVARTWGKTRGVER